MTKFEEVSNILNQSNSPDLRENCIYWLDGDKVATVNVNSRSRYASRIRKMAEKYPDDVHIFSDSDYMVACVPVKAVKISIREGREMTEEQKKALADGAEEWRRLRGDSAAIE